MFLIISTRTAQVLFPQSPQTGQADDRQPPDRVLSPANVEQGRLAFLWNRLLHSNGFTPDES